VLPSDARIAAVCSHEACYSGQPFNQPEEEEEGVDPKEAQGTSEKNRRWCGGSSGSSERGFDSTIPFYPTSTTSASSFCWRAFARLRQ
jgi:hypothetical protein